MLDTHDPRAVVQHAIGHVLPWQDAAWRRWGLASFFVLVAGDGPSSQPQVPLTQARPVWQSAGPVQGVLTQVAVVAASVAVATLVYRTIEAPLLRVSPRHARDPLRQMPVFVTLSHRV